jgi:hypothetical protein
MISRRMRIAADIAHGWARNFKLGDAHAKSVLMATSLYVNDEGSCFVGIPTLADDTELSQNTVRRKLEWLEEVRAIKRIPQWLDAYGRRTSDPLQRGNRTSDEIKLCLDVDPAEIEARARSEFIDSAGLASPPTAAGLAGDSSPPSVAGLNRVSPPLALQQPSQCWEGLNPSNGEHEEERDTRARESTSSVSTKALDIADQCFHAIGHKTGDLLNLCNLHYEINKWLRAGQERDALVEAFVHVATNYGSDKPLLYIVKGMDSFLSNAATRSVPTIGVRSTRGRLGTARSGGFIHHAIDLATEQAADG